ncbi:MAG: hypothetical protein AAGI11_01345 [Pseudomonadota bacterium]
MTRTFELLVISIFAINALPAAAAADCKLKGRELLQDADFAMEASDRRSKHWTGVQHAGEHSYTASFADGVLNIDKIGTQPWYVFRQRFRNGEHAGKKLMFSAEIKLDLDVPEGAQESDVGGGLYLQAQSRGGERITALYPHEPKLGETEWIPVHLVVRLPRTLSTLDVGFTHRADGRLFARKVSLREVKESSSRPCRITPGLES